MRLLAAVSVCIQVAEIHAGLHHVQSSIVCRSTGTCGLQAWCLMLANLSDEMRLGLEIGFASCFVSNDLPPADSGCWLILFRQVGSET